MTDDKPQGFDAKITAAREALRDLVDGKRHDVARVRYLCMDAFDGVEAALLRAVEAGRREGVIAGREEEAAIRAVIRTPEETEPPTPTEDSDD